jgi:protein-S-isoprenylcysteine O-methyltransferase Ste14
MSIAEANFGLIENMRQQNNSKRHCSCGADPSMSDETKDKKAAWEGAVKIGAATGIWAITHSILADDKVKEWISHFVGEERRVAFYRMSYNLLALLSFGALLLYIARQPRRIIYEAKGKVKWLFHAAQFASLCYGAWAALQLPVMHFSGLPHLWAYLSGKKMPREAIAQGPTVLEDDSLRVTGPFRWSRHPLNLAPLGVFWFWPTMTSKRLAFNIVATIYNLYGSVREEKHLSRATPQYRSYQESVPYFLPWRRLNRDKKAQKP